MAGTRIGGLKASKTNQERQGKDFYKRIGSMGGKTKTTKPKGFAAMPTWKVQAAGVKGGQKSRKS